MGLVTSIFCTMTFCIERIMTCVCCAFLLMLMLFGVLVMLVYGVSIGYHFSQKELASYAIQKGDTSVAPIVDRRRSGGGGDEDSAPYVKLVAVNDSARETLRRAGLIEKPKDVVLVFPTKPQMPIVGDEMPPAPNSIDVMKRIERSNEEAQQIESSQTSTEVQRPLLGVLRYLQPPNKLMPSQNSKEEQKPSQQTQMPLRDLGFISRMKREIG